MYFFKITFWSLNENWVNIINCLSTPWTTDFSENLISNDENLIYSYFIYKYGSSIKSVYFTSFNISDGSLKDSRYKSNLEWSLVTGITQNNNYVLATINTPTFTSYVVIFNTSNTQFTTFQLSSSYLTECILETQSGR